MRTSTIAAASAALLLTVGLTACTSDDGDDVASSSPETSEAPTSEEPTEDEPTEAEPTETGSTEPEPSDSPQAAGELLPMDPAPVFSTGLPQFAEGLLAEPGWEYTSPDDGQGHWGYSSSELGCTVDFFQNTLSPTALAAAGDDAATLQHLADWLGASIADVEANAMTLDIPALNGLGSGFASRTALMSGNEGTSRFVIARAFTGAGAGMVIAVECPTSEVTAEATKILVSNLSIVEL